VLAFLRELRRALAPMGATLSVAVPISEGDGYPLRRYAAAADFIVPMLCDQHADDGTAGPIAASGRQRWRSPARH
jgi:spore germination protein YaaH